METTLKGWNGKSIIEVPMNANLYEFSRLEFEKFWKFLQQKEAEKQATPELKTEGNIYAVTGDSFQKFQEACLCLGYNLPMATCIMCRATIDSLIIILSDYAEGHISGRTNWTTYEDWGTIKRSALKWGLLSSEELSKVDDEIRIYGHITAHQSAYNGYYQKNLSEWVSIMKDEERRKNEFYKVPEYLFSVPDNAKIILQKTNYYLQKIITNFLDSKMGKRIKDSVDL